MRKIVALLLIIVISFSLVNISVSATSKETDFFDSDCPLERWMAVTLLAEIFEYDENRIKNTSAPAYSDVSEDAYYFDAVNWSVCCNIISGTSGNAFSPRQQLTRGMLAYIMARTLTDVNSLVPVNYEDVSKDIYFSGAVNYVVQNGLMSTETIGDKTYFYPSAVAKVSDFAALYQNYAKDKLPLFDNMDIGSGFDFVIDKDNSVMYVNGNGELCSTGEGKLPALAYYAYSVRHIVFGEGITQIDSDALIGAGSFDGIYLPVSLNLLDDALFEQMDSYREVYFGGSVEDWEKLEYICSYRAEHLKQCIIDGKVRIFYNQTPHKHQFSDTYKYGNDATCSLDGYDRAACTIEGCAAALLRRKEGSMTGHIFENYVYNRDATRVEDGTESALCKYHYYCGVGDTRTSQGSKLVNTSNVFTDLQNNAWYLNYVDYAYTNNLFYGLSETKFAPEAAVTRAMFVTVLSRISGVKVNNDVTTVFEDVRSGQWYTGAIDWAYNNGIVYGLTDTTFGCDHKISREQLCTMLVRYADYEGIELRHNSEIATFMDLDKISPWALDAVKKCIHAYLINGEKTKEYIPVIILPPHRPAENYYDFNPHNPATRAQTAKILADFHKEYIF